MIFVIFKLYSQHISTLELVLGSKKGPMQPKTLKNCDFDHTLDRFLGMFFIENGYKTVENIRNDCIFAIFDEKYSKNTHLATFHKCQFPYKGAQYG